VAKNREKQPKVAITPAPTKAPKFSTDPKINGAPMVWRFSHGDKDGPFSWDAIYQSDDLTDVIQRLSAVESLTEKNIQESGSHRIELSALSKAAQDRLVKIKHDDLDSLFSIRVTGKKRIFCIHHGNIMRVLWYDPNPGLPIAEEGNLIKHTASSCEMA
jgi:hypothetical protein